MQDSPLSLLRLALTRTSPLGGSMPIVYLPSIDCMRLSPRVTILLDRMRYPQSGYVVAKNWLLDKVGFPELSINADAARKTRVFGPPIYDYNNGQRGGPAICYIQTAPTRSNSHLHNGARYVRFFRCPHCCSHANFRIARYA